MGAAQALVARNAKALAIVLVVALVAVVGYVLLIREDTKKGTAYFTSATNIYPGDPVEILGVKVGKIDKITPGPKHVKVEFTYEAKYKVPADAKAAIISPSLIPARYIQLAPAYTGGPVMEDGAVIPVERTAVPVEFDDLKEQLSEVTKTFGPEGANEHGALNRVLDLAPKYRGQGKQFNTFVTELSKAAETIARGSGDLFATVRNLQQFSSVLVQFDDAIREFGTRLDEVTGILADDRQTLSRALTEVEAFLKQGGVDWIRDVQSTLRPLAEDANEVLADVAAQRDYLAQVLHAGPTVVQNVVHMFHTRDGSVHGVFSAANLGQFGGAFDPACASIISAIGSSPDSVKQGQDLCAQYLGPIFKLLNNLPYPAGAPLGTAPLQVPGTGGAGRTSVPHEPADIDGYYHGADPHDERGIPQRLPEVAPETLADLLGIGGN